MEGLRAAVAFDNFIVYAYRSGFAAELVHSNLHIGRLTQQMQPYIDGLYLLDPFYIADTTSGRRVSSPWPTLRRTISSRASST